MYERGSYMKKRILLTYATYGNGHRAIAEYIQSYLKSQDPELEILAIDLLKYSIPIAGRISQKMNDHFKCIYRILSTIENEMDSKSFDIEKISPKMIKISEERWVKYINMLVDAGYIKGIEDMII